MLVCGRYEGFDERVRAFCDEELSIGDYVLTGGELAAMVVVDAVARRLPGVLGNASSALEESFEAGLLEHPQYTRPAVFRGAAVPEALLSGNHERIRRWRRASRSCARARAAPICSPRSRSATKIARSSTEKSRERHASPSLLSVALVHHPVYDKHHKVVATALTNLDLHDIARSSRTYGLERFFIVHPVAAQRELAARIAAPLAGRRGRREERLPPPGHRPARRGPDAAPTPSPPSPSATAARPVVCATAARDSAGGPPGVGFRRLRRHQPRAPALLVLGTGWGLTDELLAGCDVRLPPIRGVGDYNHLSVRSACAIILDRLYGDRED